MSDNGWEEWMKVAIIGSGIAGLATAIYLSELGLDISIHERLHYPGQEGLGFVLLENGLKALEHLGVREELSQIGCELQQFRMRTPNGKILLEENLQSTALGIKRNQFIQTLRNHINPSSLHLGHNFSHFEYDDNQNAKRAIFMNGDSVEADLFIGCDGSRSKIRNSLYPHHFLSDVRVKELVCIVEDREISRNLGNLFLKTQLEEGGLALGLMPCGNQEIVWYLQFDPTRWNLDTNATPDEMHYFAETMVGHWPDPIPDVIKKTNYHAAHVWNTVDLEVLPKLFQNNVVLVGDAAHVFLTFTSQGVNTAVQDALVLKNSLESYLQSHHSLELALTTYNAERISRLQPILDSGRQLASAFLNPSLYAGEQKIPLTK